MTKRKAFPLRLNPEIYRRVARWAEDELRSVNAQIEFLLLEALRRSGRWKERQAKDDDPSRGSDRDS